MFCYFRRWKIRSFLSQKVHGTIIFTGYWKVLVLNFSEMGNTVIFKSKSWWNYIFTDYWKVHVLNYSEMRNTVFFWAKKLMKDNIYWLMKSFCFVLFGDGKYGLFLSQKFNGKMIFTWSFWAYHDIPGLAKNGFSCTVWDIRWIGFKVRIIE